MQVDSISQTQPADSSRAFRKHEERGGNAPVKSEQKDSAENEKVAQDAKLAKVKSVLAAHDINLKFSQDQDTNQIVVELVDANTGEEIRQYPSEVSLKLAAISEKIQGRFIDKQL